MRFSSKILFFLFVFLFHQGFAKNDSTAKVKLSVNAGLILNRAYSHINYRTQNPSNKFNHSETSPVGNADALMPGFSSGVSAAFGKKDKMNFIMGLGYSFTTAKYHLSTSSTSPSGYTYTARSTEIDIGATHHLINIEFGLRLKLFKNFFITNSLLSNRAVNVIEKQKGYSSVSDVTPVSSSKTSTDIDHTETHRSFSSASYRFGLEYKFKIKKQEIGFYGYRNFAAYTSLPWWGMGFNFAVN